LPRALLDFARGGGDAGMAALKEPVEYIRLDAETKISENLKIAFFQVRPEEKIGALLVLLRHRVKKDEQTIIFTATRHHVEFLGDVLQQSGYTVSPIFGQMDQSARTIHLSTFKAKKSSILLVTDVAARGIDIPMLANVINFDFPARPKLFVHRVGRTARQNRDGTAYSLVANDELPYMLDLFLFLGKSAKTHCDDPAELESGVFYGAMPRRQLEEEGDTARSIIGEDTGIQALQRASNNAYKLYQKTRVSASKASAMRTKELVDVPDVHPWMVEMVAEADSNWTDLMGSVRNYTPRSTILEQKESSAAFDVMKRKRRTDGWTVLAKRKEVPIQIEPSMMVEHDYEEQVGNAAMKEHQWKDKEFFIDYEPANRDRAADFGFEIGGSMQAEDMVMDLSGDTASALLKSKQVRKWDAKKKKYVMMELDNEGRAKRQKLNDSGNFVKKDAKVKGRSYSDWQKKMRTTIQKPGEEESAAAGVSSGDQYMWVAGRRVKIGGEGVGLSTAKGAKGMVAKDELRNKDQIAKLRKEDEKNKNRNSKNHSGGKSAAFSKGGKAGNGATASAGKASAPGHGKNGAFKSKSKPTLAASKKTKGTKGKKNSASKGKKK